MNKFKFWQNWLIIVCLIIIAYGVYFVLFVNSSLFQPIEQIFKYSFSVKEIATLHSQISVLVFGVLGATMIGWGITMLIMIHFGFKEKKLWTWYSVFFGILTWFIPDTTISWSTGAVINVWLNIIILTIFLLPLLMCRKYFINIF